MKFLEYIKGLYNRQENTSNSSQEMEEIKNHINNENSEQ